MNASLALLRVNWRRMRNYSDHIDQGKALQLGLTLLCIILFVLFTERLLLMFLGFMYNTPPLGPVMVPTLLHLSLLASFGLLALLGIVATLTHCYLAPDLPLMFSLPAKVETIFWSKHLQGVVAGSWTVLVLLLPMLSSFGKVTNAPVGYSLYLAAGMICLVLVAAGLAAGLTLLCARYLSATRVRYTAIAMGVTLLAAFGLAMKYWSDRHVQVLDRLMLLNQVLGRDVRWTSYQPGAWLARGLLDFSEGRFPDALFALSLLATTAVVVHLPFLWLTWDGGVYHQGWQHAQAGGGQRKRTLYGKELLPRLLRPLPANVAAMLTRDLRLWTRDALQWVQFGILLGLVLVYVTNTSRLPIDREDPLWSNVLLLINIAMVGVVLATFALRFLYPYVSMEGDAVWVTLMSSMSMGRFLALKFTAGMLWLLLLGHAVIWVANGVLDVKGQARELTQIMVTLQAVGLAGLCVGLGAAFPRFDLRRAVEIASTGGALLAMMLSLLYVASLVLFCVWSLQDRMRGAVVHQAFGGEITWTFVQLAAAITVPLALIPLLAGWARLRRLEV